MNRYNIYEPRGADSKSFIGSVEAETMADARRKGIEKFGGTIIVKEDS
jgi:hypothetical protein